MTDQEVFNKVLFNLREQGIASTGGKGLCLYRGSNGTKCAFGWLIPDSVYHHSMEGKPVELLGKDVLNSCSLHQQDTRFLVELQEAHDHHMPIEPGDSMNMWESVMKDLAEFHQLKYTPTT